MFTISRSVCIDASTSTVWRVLSDLESIDVWVESIKRSYCVNEHTRGVDAVRVCEVDGNFKIRETIVDGVEGESFAYVGEGAPLMKRAINQWRVEARGSQTLVTTSAEVELKGGFLGGCSTRCSPALQGARARGLWPDSNTSSRARPKIARTSDRSASPLPFPVIPDRHEVASCRNP